MVGKSENSYRKIGVNLKKTLIALGEWETAGRVGSCGKKVVLECPSCGGRHLHPYSCGHKACGRCAGVQRWKKVAKLWPLVKGFKEPRFLTLTFKNRAHLTPEWRRKQFATFRKFLKNRFIADHLEGGVWCWEVTYNRVTKTWHPHFHILFDGKWTKHEEIKKIWFALTGDSFIVDVRDVQGEGDEGKLGALRETVKYITKAVSIADDEKLLEEFLTATKNMRRIGLFGKCHGYKPPAPPPTDKRFWHVNPFTGRGPKPIGCGCGYEALPQFFRLIGGRGVLHDDAAAQWLARERGAPDPVLLREQQEVRERDRDLTFEEVFRES